MAAAHATRPELAKRIIINGETVIQESPIRNKEDVQFHVANFKNKKYCNLMIYAVTYTDDGVAQADTAQPVPAPTPVLLGTIKIGS